MQPFSSSSAEDLRPSEVHFEWIYTEVQFSIFSLQCLLLTHTHSYVSLYLRAHYTCLSLSLSVKLLLQLSFDGRWHL